MHLPIQTIFFFSANAAPDEHQTDHWGQAAFTEHFRRVN